jgi:hypothetical protein
VQRLDSAFQCLVTRIQFFRITSTFFWMERNRNNERRRFGSRKASQQGPKKRRAPERRAITGDLGDKSKAEARSRRNCWRGARSVSPDINPRLRAFVPTSMRRSKVGLSLKIFATGCALTKGTSAMDKVLRIKTGDLCRNQKDWKECLSYLKRLIISEVE